LGAQPVPYADFLVSNPNIKRQNTAVKRHSTAHWLKLCLVLLLAAASPAGARDRGVPPSEGIGNFGKVNDGLYRGAQPDAAGIKNLAQLGIKTIINLCMTNELWKAEASEASAIGITYTNVPLKGLGRPSDAQVAKLLTLIETLPGPVFIHCQHGCDRTGTIVACYRIKHHSWSSESALEEAAKYGLSKYERGMRKYILEFGNTSPWQ
jgi:protein tyrosine phosphatase (PTP) superfamily phosphohydrolase (DUF442 family)